MSNILNIIYIIYEIIKIIWNIPILKYSAIALITSYVCIMVILYYSEKYQKYMLNIFIYYAHIIASGIYGGVFLMCGTAILSVLLLEKETQHPELWRLLFMGLSVVGCLAVRRIGLNIICWYLGTALWPWNPFIKTPEWNAVIAKNRRDARQRWVAERRRSRTEGKRFSD